MELAVLPGSHCEPGVINGVFAPLQINAEDLAVLASIPAYHVIAAPIFSPYPADDPKQVTVHREIVTIGLN